MKRLNHDRARFGPEPQRSGDSGTACISFMPQMAAAGLPQYKVWEAWRRDASATFKTLDPKSALPPLVACRFFQQNLSWCFGELEAESLMDQCFEPIVGI